MHTETHTQTRTHVQGRRERVRKRVRRVTFVPTCRESAGQSKVSSTLITLDTGFHFVLGLSVAVVPTCVCVCVFMGHHCYCFCLTVSGYPCLPVTRPVATCSILMIFFEIPYVHFFANFSIHWVVSKWRWLVCHVSSFYFVAVCGVIEYKYV